MRFRAIHRHPTARAFTIMEVLVSALLISMALGSIVTINMKSISTLRASREASASSQMLQQRIEMIRSHSWAEVASSPAMAALMRTATVSEAELSEPQVVETMKVTVPKPSNNGPVESDRSFSVRRRAGVVQVDQTGDFSTEPTLFFEGMVLWHDESGTHQRRMRTIVCRQGLTRSGITGSVLGRPGAERTDP